MQTENNFLDDVIRVLLNARRILSASYCIGYFIPPENREQIQAHETLQVGSEGGGECREGRVGDRGVWERERGVRGKKDDEGSEGASC